MKGVKKFAVAVLAAVLAFSMFACSNKQGSDLVKKQIAAEVQNIVAATLKDSMTLQSKTVSTVTMPGTTSGQPVTETATAESVTEYQPTESGFNFASYKKDDRDNGTFAVDGYTYEKVGGEWQKTKTDMPPAGLIAGQNTEDTLWLFALSTLERFATGNSYAITKNGDETTYSMDFNLADKVTAMFAKLIEDLDQPLYKLLDDVLVILYGSDAKPVMTALDELKASLSVDMTVTDAMAAVDALISPYGITVKEIFNSLFSNDALDALIAETDTQYTKGATAYDTFLSAFGTVRIADLLAMSDDSFTLESLKSGIEAFQAALSKNLGDYLVSIMGRDTVEMMKKMTITAKTLTVNANVVTDANGAVIRFSYAQNLDLEVTMKMGSLSSTVNLSASVETTADVTARGETTVTLPDGARDAIDTSVPLPPLPATNVQTLAA